MDPACAIIHTLTNSFRNDKSIVSHITAINSEQAKESSKSSTLGINYIMRAKLIEEENVAEGE